MLGVDVNPPKFAMEDYAPTLAMSFEQVNLLDKEAVEDMICNFSTGLYPASGIFFQCCL